MAKSKIKYWGCLFVMAAIILFMGLVVFSFLQGNQYGEHVALEDCPAHLPENATDISYMIPGAFWPNTAFEFSTTEDSFRKWATENGWPPKEIVSKPITIHRYIFFRDNDRNAIAEITDGLYYEWHKEDQGIYTGFDRKTKRAYYHSHTR